MPAAWASRAMKEIVALIGRMATENPPWGYSRITRTSVAANAWAAYCATTTGERERGRISDSTATRRTTVIVIDERANAPSSPRRSALGREAVYA